MTRSNLFFLIIGLVLLLLSIVFEDPSQESNWDAFPSYSSLDNRPYGAEALLEALPDLFPDQEIQVTRRSIYEVLIENDESGFNYLFIDQSFAPQFSDTYALLRYVQEGAKAFVAAETFSGQFADTLSLKTDTHYQDEKDSLSLSFTQLSDQDRKEFLFLKRTVNTYFKDFEEEGSQVLAKNNLGDPVLIKIKIGKGALILSSTPLAYTNYNLLQAGNADYIARSMSHLPNEPLHWDEYYKSGRGENQSPYRFIMSRRSLRTAFYLGLIGLAFWVLVSARRKQRVIPVRTLPENKSLEFVEVLGRTFYNHRNHSEIAQKKIQFFWEYLRGQYYLQNLENSLEEQEKLAMKSGRSPEEVQDLVKAIQTSKNNPNLREAELVSLHRKMQKFK